MANFNPEDFACFTHEHVLAFETVCNQLRIEFFGPSVCHTTHITFYYLIYRLTSKTLPRDILWKEESVATHIETPEAEEFGVEDRSMEALSDDVAILWTERERLQSEIEGTPPFSGDSTAGASSHQKARKHLKALRYGDAAISRRLTVAHVNSLFEANYWLASLQKAEEHTNSSILHVQVRDIALALIERHAAMHMELEYLKVTFSSGS